MSKKGACPGCDLMIQLGLESSSRSFTESAYNLMKWWCLHWPQQTTLHSWSFSFSELMSESSRITDATGRETDALSCNSIKGKIDRGLELRNSFPTQTVFFLLLAVVESAKGPRYSTTALGGDSGCNEIFSTLSCSRTKYHDGSRGLCLHMFFALRARGW